MKYPSRISSPSHRNTSKVLPAVHGLYALKRYSLLGLPLAAATVLFLSSML